MLTARREASRSPVSRAAYTFMLSVRRDFTARICQHITLSAASRSHGLIKAHTQRTRAGRAADTAAVSSHSTPPALRSPSGVRGKMARR